MIVILIITKNKNSDIQQKQGGGEGGCLWKKMYKLLYFFIQHLHVNICGTHQKYYPISVVDNKRPRSFIIWLLWSLNANAKCFGGITKWYFHFCSTVLSYWNVFYPKFHKEIKQFKQCIIPKSGILRFYNFNITSKQGAYFTVNSIEII